MLRFSFNIFGVQSIRAITCLLFLFAVTASCSHDSDLRSALDAAHEKFINNDFDDMQSLLLKAEDFITEDTPVSDKEYLERLKGINFLELRVMDKAKVSLQKALDYSKLMNDTSLIIQNSFNLGLCSNSTDEGIDIYEYIVELAEDSKHAILPDALEKLAQGYISRHDYTNAQRSLDRAYKLAENNHIISQQIAFTQCELWLAEGNRETALEGFRSIPTDSCSIIGKLVRANNIYNILYDLGDYKNALAYKDSVQQFTDSMKNIDGESRIQRIEEVYKQNEEKERRRFNGLLYSSSGAIAIIAVVLFFVLKNMGLKRKQVALSNRIAELNVKLSAMQQNEGHGDNPIEINDTDSVQELIMEKFRLSTEILKTQPQYELLKKLNLTRDFDTADKQEIRDVSSEIIGRFADACSNLRQSVPSMTNDDCLLCSMSCCGCSKEVISAMMGSSEEAVRRRKSRVKQKLPEKLFVFFFR